MEADSVQVNGVELTKDSTGRVPFWASAAAVPH